MVAISISENSAHNGTLNSLKIRFENGYPAGVSEGFNAARARLKTRMNRYLRNLGNFQLKVNMAALIKYSKDGNISEIQHHWSGTKTLNNEAYVDSTLNELLQGIIDKVDSFSGIGSGWVFYSLEGFDVKVARARVIRGASFVELPDWINNKKACVNIKNNDEQCFKWCILAALHPAAKNPDRLSHYTPYQDELKFDGIQIPVRVKDVAKFEQLNPTVSVNILGVEGKNIVPLSVSAQLHVDGQPPLTEINLLKYQEHYVLVKSMSRLLNNKNTATKSRVQYSYCPNCLAAYRTKEQVEEHRKQGCNEHKPRIDKLPEPSKAFVKYKDFRTQAKLPYIIYADFESIIQKTNKTTIKGTETEHIPCGYKFIVVDEEGNNVKEHLYQGPNAAKDFIEQVDLAGAYIMDKYKTNLPMVMTDADEIKYNASKECYLCKEKFGQDMLSKVRDHNHITGAYRGALHKKCNLNYNNRFTKIPVVFHNGRGYDTHLFMKELTEHFSDINVIPKTSDSYISITADKFQFVDSLAHLTNSLDNLVKSLKSGGEDAFKLTKKHYGENTKDYLRKGVYPYEYMDSFDRFNETELPPIEAFHSSIYGSCKEEDYEYAKFMFNKHCHNSMREYHNMYLESDVYLLADVFENHRKLSLEYYEIDPAWYITLPSLSWNSLLKKTKEKIDVFNDQQKDMLLMTERGIRGGISVIVKRNSEADNDKMLRYFDANNLYGWAMYQALPTGDYKWEKASDFTPESISHLSDESERGYLFEVDLHVPQNKHEYLRDYPPAPEHALITDDMLSPYTKELKEKLAVKSDTTKKLILSLRDKPNYVIHYRLLKHYLDLGVQIKKISRAISFKQSKWMMPYIDFNSQKRAASTTEFQKDFFKLMNNSVFGKTIENVRKRSATKIFAGTSPDLNKLNNWKNHRIFSETLSAVEFQKTKDKLDKPIIVGQAILDYSKLLMSESFYKLKSHYPNMKLCMSDTDSMILELPKKFDNDLLSNEELKDMFDLSNFNPSSPFFDEKNKTVVGKFKDEMFVKEDTEKSHYTIDAFVGLRAKMYCCLSHDEIENKPLNKKVAKGIDKKQTKKLTYDAYKTILDNKTSSKVSFNNIRSKGHELFTIKVNKIGLSAYDNKFYQLDNINSVPYGYAA